MATLWFAFIFVFGLIIGSFLNVVILRYNTGKSIGGRSACFSCGQTLHWQHLIPILSFFAQGGKCAFCKSKISWQYPLVELATGLLFVLVLYSFPFHIPYFIFYILSVCFSTIIFVYDIKHKIIPDGIVYGFIALGLVMTGLRGFYIYDFISAFGISLFFFSLWYFSKGTWMGLGDAKLGLAIGLFLPFSQNITSIVISFWIGAIFGVILICYERLAKIMPHRAVFPASPAGRWGPQKTALCGNHSMKSELPFAPFLLIGMFVVLFTQIDLLSLTRLFILN